MIPINVFLVAWVWIGRLVYGVAGWFVLIFLISVVPVVLVALLVTTILASTQHGQPRSLTPVQTWAQLATWLALLVFGAFMPDFADNPGSQRSLLTQVFGYSDDLYDLGFLIAFVAGGAAVAAYAVLLGSLSFSRREATPVPVS